MKHAIIGTAGHVDHGKTTLIKALTGTDTDRLPEEQERGMTIDIGFAALRLPDGTTAGIVDVPGHERFVKNMLAGAAGVDVALLVVAADEGVMPQTSEHLDILQLLDVSAGVVALTKADTVEPEWLSVVEEDLRAHLKGTFLSRAPIVTVDSISGRGIERLVRELHAAVSRARPRTDTGAFRLPVDRVFTRPGFGAVATGTLVAGTLRLGDPVEVSPAGVRGRVRGLQSHGRSVEFAAAGTRTAVNLAGIASGDLARGQVLAPPGVLQASRAADLVVHMLPGAARALRTRARVRLHLGSAEVIGRVTVIGAAEVPLGGRGYVHVRTESPFACARGDRFVLRSYSPMATIGGGRILDPCVRRARPGDGSVLGGLAALESGTPDSLVDAWLRPLPLGAARRDAQQATGLGATESEDALLSAEQRGDAVALPGGRVIHREVLLAASSRAQGALDAFHAANPMKPGMPREELRAVLGRDGDPRAFAALLQRLQSDGVLVSDATTVRAPAFAVKLNPRQQALLDRVREAYRGAGFAPPSLQAAAASAGAPPEAVSAVLQVGMDRGEFVRIAEGVVYDAGTLSEARRIVRETIEREGSITAAAFRDATGTSRKHAVPLLEYLDSIGFTVRRGDARILGRSG
ncbi:MAG TPA: selenocysteine-specific translation elongation factor [Chthonomonadales bacterium]|nr:selenocysteine-specific translation elongation factor [Chthonomonadales bacterium]